MNSFGDVVVESSPKVQYLIYDNILENWNVEEFPIPTFDFVNIAESCLWGGVVTPNEEPIHGNDHRYFYLAFQEGRYTNFNNYYVDSNVCLFYWREGLSNWAMLALWPNTESLDELFSSKAYKPSSSTNGHLAGLNSEGDLTDSGIAADDVATQQDLATKQDTIQDLAAIRSGAAAGATALQESDITPIENRLQNIEEDVENLLGDLANGKLYGGIINTQSTVQPDTSCYYIAEEGGTYSAFGVTVNSNERVQIIIHNGTAWEVVSLNMYNYGYAHGKFDKVDDIDSLLTDIVPSSSSSSNQLATTSDVNEKFNELEEEVGTIGNGAYEEAWDGSSAPVVADIPAGVSVTYNSTSYTGTLAASASTVDKIYLVSDGNGNYDRYVTVESSGTYSWKKVGTTAIPLSNYATESEVSQLRQEVTGDISQLEAKVTDLQDGETVLQQQIDAIHPVVIEGNVTNAPDNEDITATPDNRLKFADRTATLTNKGYKILRADKTFASQVTDINTIYEVRYQFDLNDGEVEIPSGCELHFNGGRIINGKIVYNNTVISGDYSLDCDCSGPVGNDFATPEMYGAKGDGQSDDSLAIQAAIDGGNLHIVFNAPKYLLDVRKQSTYRSVALEIHSRSNLLLEFVNSTLELAGNDWSEYRMFDILNSSSIKIIGGDFIGDKDTHDYGFRFNLENKEWDGTSLIDSSTNCITTPIPVSYLSNFDGTNKKPYSMMIDNGYLDVNNYDSIAQLTTKYILFQDNTFVAEVNAISDFSQYPNANYFRRQINGTIVVDDTKIAYISNSYIDHNNYRKTHEQGLGVCIVDSAGISLVNIKTHGFTGDGILVSGDLSTNGITIKDVGSYDNRRQGITVGGGDNIEIENVYIHDICGTNPSCGIDVELETSLVRLGTVNLRNCKFANIWSYNVILTGTYLSSSPLARVNADGCIFDNNVSITKNACVGCTFETEGNKYLSASYKRGNVLEIPEGVEDCIIHSERRFYCNGGTRSAFKHETIGSVSSTDSLFGTFDGCYFYKVYRQAYAQNLILVNCRVDNSFVKTIESNYNVFVASTNLIDASCKYVSGNTYYNARLLASGATQLLVTGCSFIESANYEVLENIDGFISVSSPSVVVSKNTFITSTISCIVGYIPTGTNVVASNNIITLTGSSWVSDNNTINNYWKRLKFTNNTINLTPTATILNANLTHYEIFNRTSFVIPRMTESIKTQIEKFIQNNEGISVYSFLPLVTFNTDILAQTKDDAIKGQMALDNGVVKTCSQSSTYDATGTLVTNAVWA